MISAAVLSSLTLKEPFDLPPISSGAIAAQLEINEGPFSSDLRADVFDSTLTSTYKNKSESSVMNTEGYSWLMRFKRWHTPFKGAVGCQFLIELKSILEAENIFLSHLFGPKLECHAIFYLFIYRLLPVSREDFTGIQILLNLSAKLQ